MRVQHIEGEGSDRGRKPPEVMHLPVHEEWATRDEWVPCGCHVMNGRHVMEDWPVTDG